MQLIKDQQIIENEWQHADEISELPDGKITVPVSRWQTEREALISRGNIGLRLIAIDTLETIKDDLQHFKIIAIEFEKFNDGRGFSLAHLLRERYGYEGEIRAIGAVIRDQLYYLQRSGFDAFELSKGQDLQEALNAFGEFTVQSQPDVLHKKDVVLAGPWR
ncbi:MAG: DUF934 domain-containing protein [Gammaproteobacteria bacterium]|nr:DUF934 domain-containing protein [Gammaproteobacteria bacterium]